MRSIRTFFLQAAAAIFWVSGSPATAAVLTFNGTAPEGVSVFAGTTYTEAGFTLAMGGGSMFFVDNSDSAFPALLPFDDDVLEFNDTTAFFTMTKVGGGLFNLSSVMTGSLGRSPFDDGNFIFTGTFGSGGTVSQVVPALGFGVPPSTTTFSGFNALTSLTVTTSDGFFPVMDNITVTAAVPEPGTLALLGIAFAGLGFARRRKLH